MGVGSDLRAAAALLLDAPAEAQVAALAELRAMRAALEALTAGDAALIRKRRRAAAALGAVRDRRRFPVSAPAVGRARVVAEADAAGTIFPSKVEAVGRAAVLKDGAMNAKIGGDVHKGWLRGARIYTLTLEERATCPRACQEWRTCYGNAMNHSVRWRHGPALEERLRAEVAALCAAHRLVLIRLHVLGDFYSTGYVDLWAELLRAHPGLAVFGFTAWSEASPIGSRVGALRVAFGRRWSVRHSGRGGPWDSFVIDFPTDQPRLGDAIVCPEQFEANRGREGRHCGNCALCWQGAAPIVFVRH